MEAWHADKLPMQMLTSAGAMPAKPWFRGELQDPGHQIHVNFSQGDPHRWICTPSGPGVVRNAERVCYKHDAFTTRTTGLHRPSNPVALLCSLAT